MNPLFKRPQTFLSVWSWGVKERERPAIMYLKKSYLWLEKEWLNSPWSQNQNSHALCMQNHINQKELRSLLKDLSQLPHIHIYMTFDQTFTHQSACQTLINMTYSTPIMWIFQVKQDIEDNEEKGVTLSIGNWLDWLFNLALQLPWIYSWWETSGENRKSTTNQQNIIKKFI